VHGQCQLAARMAQSFWSVPDGSSSSREARATARHTAELLRDQGLVVKVPGLGTFVRKPEHWRTSG
jgi:hypothetical protein